MKEILKSFLETTNERIKNPLIGTFIISWIVINWKPITLLFFSNQTIENRITFIESNYGEIYNYLFIPLFFALFYVIILPYIMWGIETLMKRATIERKRNIINQMIIDYEGKQEIAIEESKLEDLKANYRDKADFNNQIKQLRNQLDQREVQILNQKEQINQVNLEKKQLNKTILEQKEIEENNPEFIKNQEQYESFKDSDLFEYFEDIGISLRSYSRFPNMIKPLIQEKFLINNIVEEVFEEDNILYRFTDKGKFFWSKFVTNLDLRKSKELIIDDSEPDDLPF